jgi:hypothetical protein
MVSRMLLLGIQMIPFTFGGKKCVISNYDGRSNSCSRRSNNYHPGSKHKPYNHINETVIIELGTAHKIFAQDMRNSLEDFPW